MATIANPDLEQIIVKAREAQRADSPSALSIGEAVAAALVLNRPDWLARMGYTLADAIERIGPDWARLIPAAANQVQTQTDSDAYAEAERLRQEKWDKIREQRGADDEIDLSAKLVTYGNAPGYRDVSAVLDLAPIGEAGAPTVRACIHVTAQDGLRLAEHILEVHRFAWQRDRPLDAKQGESKPAWIDGRVVP